MRQRESSRQVEISSQTIKPMGIDIYARWENQTDDEVKAQIKAYMDATVGNVGYLREAYHGEPYATRYFVPEAFKQDEGVPIPARILRERLPETLRLAEKRERTIYRATKPEDFADILKSYTDFVELCERKEKETGELVRIIASW